MLEMRTSERADLNGCTQKWWWATVENLRPNRAANPLWFGSAVHEALAAWYLRGLKRGPHPADTFNEFLEGDRTILVTNENEEEEYFNARELGTDMLNRYVAHYGKDDSWDVIATEHKGKIILPRPARTIYGRKLERIPRWLRYHFTWDGIFRDLNDGQLWLMEHKTAASIVLNHLPLDNQAGSYWAIADRSLRKQGIISDKDGIVGIRYNFLRKAMADQRPRNDDGHYTNKPLKQHYLDAITPITGDAPFKRGDKLIPMDKATLAELEAVAEGMRLTVLGEVSKVQPPPFFVREDVYRTAQERETQIRRIQDEAFMADSYRRGELPITKRPSRDCSWCPYNRMCELDEQGDQDAVEMFKETQFHTESPYEVYGVKSA